MLPIKTMLIGGGLGRFTRTINIVSSATIVNVRSLANAAGYLGDRPAVLTLNLAPGVQLDAGLYFGIWPNLAHSMQLNVAGNVHGNAGIGGEGGDGTSGFDGEAGGDAIFCTIDAVINVAATANIKGGGGGGGGGGGSFRMAGPPGEEGLQTQIGGGGGNGWPFWSDGPGNGGAGGVNPADPGISGTAGSALTTGLNPWTNAPGGNYGVGGYAIRFGGRAITVNNTGGVIAGVQA